MERFRAGDIIGAVLVSGIVGYAGGIGIAFLTGFLGRSVVWTNELAYGTCFGIMLPVLALLLFLVHRARGRKVLPPPPPGA